MVRAADLELRTGICRFCFQNRSFFAFEGVWTIPRVLDCFRMVEPSKKCISNLFLAYKHSVGDINGQIGRKTGSLSSVNHPTQNSLNMNMVIESLSSGGGLDIFSCAELSSAILGTYPCGIKRFMDVSWRRKKLGSIP